ncbi:S-adenosyl-L-methionine-dependent methyltransferase [Daedaleopsis nitida]|nr:S-adenosyl-L-methionine-dependent methyltransferase [Daedaleopsis nitida]
MASTHPRSRSSTPSGLGPPPEKKQRLDEPSSLEPAEPIPIQDTPADYQLVPDTSDAAPVAKKPAKQTNQKKNKKRNVRRAAEPYSGDDILIREVIELLGTDYAREATSNNKDWDAPFEQSTQLELTVSCISPSIGESLSIATHNDRKWVIVTPLSLPGERIRARVYRHSRLHSRADLLEVLEPNHEMRDMSRVRCQYFGKCAGCQYQMLSYEAQLDLKRQTVVQAYKNYSSIAPELVPPIKPTIGSPLQYGYRTKLTPHFQKPKAQKPILAEGKPDWLKIGFHQVGTRHVMDIEECPIATPVINKALTPIREDVIKNITKYKNGATLLLRESLPIPTEPEPEPSANADTDGDPICVTDQKGTVRERVGDLLFEYTAGTFFQNNNSALIPLTSYVRDAIFPTAADDGARPKPTHLVDAYCGSGLFALTLARHFSTIAGIELSAESIRAAERNLALNAPVLSSSSSSASASASATPEVTFMSGDAANIFSTVQHFPRAHTVLVIDPPRKGTDARFIEQMLAFGAHTVIYVSCNVHTQARDVGMILARSAAQADDAGDGEKYVLESLCGLDLFPQTAHVEAIAVLRLV